MKHRRKPVDSLRMERVHLEGLFADEPREKPTFRDANFMRWTILHVELRVLVFAVVAAAGLFVDVLMQRAAECDVQLLEPAAKTKDRHAGSDRSLEERHRRGIAIFIELGAIARRAAIV